MAESLHFLEVTVPPPAGLCYDVGNAIRTCIDAATELRMLGQRVSHIHAKDKNAAGENVRFGTGTVDFGSVLTAMAECMFEGLVTMESTRGDDPIATAAEHRAFLLSIGGHEH